MKIEDFATEPLVIKPGEAVSKVASKLLSSGRHEAVIMEGAECRGIVTAFDLIRKRIDDPAAASIELYSSNINPLMPGTPVSEIINSMVINDYKAVPIKVFSGGRERLLVVTKIDLLNFVSGDENLKRARASDLMSTPYYVNADDYVSTARSMMKELGISHLVVLDGGRFEGVIEPLDIMGVLYAERTRSSSVTSKGPGKKTSLDRIALGSFSSRNTPTAAPDTPAKDIIALMTGRKANAVVILDGGKATGIITPKDILKVAGEETGGVYVTVSGLGEEDEFIRGVIDAEIGRSMRKLSKMLPLRYFYMHVHRYHKKHKSGERTEYEIKAKLIAGKGAFFSQATEWDVTKATKDVLNRLETEIIKRKERGLL